MIANNQQALIEGLDVDPDRTRKEELIDEVRENLYQYRNMSKVHQMVLLEVGIDNCQMQTPDNKWGEPKKASTGPGNFRRSGTYRPHPNWTPDAPTPSIYKKYKARIERMQADIVSQGNQNIKLALKVCDLEKRLNALQDRPVAASALGGGE